MELLGLKDQYEETFGNHWKALNDGKCHLLSNNIIAAQGGSQTWSHDRAFASSSGDTSGSSSRQQLFTSRAEEPPEASGREETFMSGTRDTSQPSTRGLSFISETEERDLSPDSTEWPDSEDESVQNGDYGGKENANPGA
jgi:hypothetical protein